MRIGLDIRAMTQAPSSAMGRQALALYNALRQRPSTDVLPFTNAPLTHPHRTWACCPSRPVTTDRLFGLRERYWFERRFLPEALSALAVDLYIATDNMGLPLGLSDVRRKRTRWVLQLHDLFQLTHAEPGGAMPTPWRQWHDRWRIGVATRLADAIWVPSSYTAQRLADLYPDTLKRIRVLPHAVPTEPWQRVQQEVFAPQRYWLVVGSRGQRKNIAWFVQAWQRARDTWPVLIPPLVLIGHPRDVPGAPEQVRFVHGINDAQLSAWYSKAERLWCPALAEGFGLPVVEAVACGTPVATARGSALDEVTPPCGLRFDPLDEAGLVQLMHRAALQGRTEAEAPAVLLDWARRFDLPIYTRRVDALLQELA